MEQVHSVLWNGTGSVYPVKTLGLDYSEEATAETVMAGKQVADALQVVEKKSSGEDALIKSGTLYQKKSPHTAPASKVKGRDGYLAAHEQAIIL